VLWLLCGRPWCSWVTDKFQSVLLWVEADYRLELDAQNGIPFALVIFDLQIPFTLVQCVKAPSDAGFVNKVDVSFDKIFINFNWCVYFFHASSSAVWCFYRHEFNSACHHIIQGVRSSGTDSTNKAEPPE
jgi:hypothetical protein